MSWFRHCVCAWVALLALAIQLGLSFGHVHALNGERPAAVQTAATDSTSSPAPQNGADHDDDYCAICAVLALLSGAQTASAPDVPLPIFVTSAELLTNPETIVSDTPRAAF